MLLSGEFWQKRICRREFDKSLLAGQKCGKAASWRCKRSQDEPLLEGRGVPWARWRCLCYSQNLCRRSGELFQTNLAADRWTSRALQDWYNGNFCIGYRGHAEIVDILRMFWTHQYYGIFRNCYGGRDILNILRLQGISLTMYGGRLWQNNHWFCINH